MDSVPLTACGDARGSANERASCNICVPVSTGPPIEGLLISDISSARNAPLAEVRTEVRVAVSTRTAHWVGHHSLHCPSARSPGFVFLLLRVATPSSLRYGARNAPLAEVRTEVRVAASTQTVHWLGDHSLHCPSARSLGFVFLLLRFATI
uniref:Uncharacterized protein n=1 Tax=Steinernema glaseri TaxID=37863 RepID=A0A1I7YS84_9BILA